MTAALLIFATIGVATTVLAISISIVELCDWVVTHQKKIMQATCRHKWFAVDTGITINDDEYIDAVCERCGKKKTIYLRGIYYLKKFGDSNQNG